MCFLFWTHLLDIKRLCIFVAIESSKNTMRILQRPYIECEDIMRQCNVHAIRHTMRLALPRSGTSAVIRFSEKNQMEALRRIPDIAKIAVERSRDIFVSRAAVSQDVSISLHRVGCPPYTSYMMPPHLFPMTDSYSDPDVMHAVYGLLCVSRENVSGGVHRFETFNGDTWTRELMPGELVVFKPHFVQHTLDKPLQVWPNLCEEGFVDYVVFCGFQEKNTKLD